MTAGTIPGTVLVDHSATGPAGSSPGSTSDPSAPGLAWEAQQPAVTKARDVYGGTVAMQAAGKTYLAQFPQEEEEAYAERLGRARLYGMFRATVDGLTDMVWRQPLLWAEDLPEELAEVMRNVDLEGRAVDEFAREGFRDKETVGHVHYFADWYSPTRAPASSASEGGARPYAAMITKEQLLRFRTENRGGKIILTSFAYLSEDVVPDGEFGEEAILRVKEYRLLPAADGSTIVGADGVARPREEVIYRSWTKPADASSSEWAPEESGRSLGTRMTEIPLVTDYAGRTGFMTSEPPLSDLIEENVEHYQIRSERRQSLGIAGIAILCITGCPKEEVETVAVGPSIGLVLPEDADAKYLETTGAALTSYREELQDIEARATSLGLAMLQRQKRVAETAEAHKLDRVTEQSKLAAQANATAAALRELTRYFAMWMGLPYVPDEGTVEVNTDFDVEPLTPQQIAELRAMVAEDILTVETMWQLLVEGEVLPDTFDPEVEKEAIEASVARRVAAIEAAMATREPPAGEDEDEDATGDEGLT